MSEENNTGKVFNKVSRVQKEFRKQTLGYIVGALSLVAGLAWNDAVKTIIEYIFPLDKNSMWIKLIYAVILTVIIILVTISLNRFLGPDEEKSE